MLQNKELIEEREQFVMEKMLILQHIIHYICNKKNLKKKFSEMEKKLNQKIYKKKGILLELLV